jgi:FkbM family methyltransferase
VPFNLLELRAVRKGRRNDDQKLDAKRKKNTAEAQYFGIGEYVNVKSMRAKLNWAVLPIFRGPLRGFWWLLATRSSFLFGKYEPEQTKLFGELVKPGDVVFDVGAHFGYYTLLASKLVGDSGKVISFEPSPANLARLYRHIELNSRRNVQVLELAVSDHEGTARFETRTGSGVGHLADDGPLEVRLTTLDSLTQLPRPQVMKIDVEGAEVGVLQGAKALLQNARPIIFLSLHGEELKATCLEILEGYGYTFRHMEPMEILAIPPKR